MERDESKYTMLPPSLEEMPLVDQVRRALQMMSPEEEDCLRARFGLPPRENG